MEPGSVKIPNQRIYRLFLPLLVIKLAYTCTAVLLMHNIRLNFAFFRIHFAEWRSKDNNRLI